MFVLRILEKRVRKSYQSYLDVLPNKRKKNVIL